MPARGPDATFPAVSDKGSIASMLYLAIAVLAAMAALVLGYALVRRPRAAASRIEHDLEVYRAQLDELNRERLAQDRKSVV